MGVTYCCAEFAKARAWGTDAEGYGEEIELIEADSVAGGSPYSIGYTLAPIQFCPWCGTALAAQRRPESMPSEERDEPWFKLTIDPAKIPRSMARRQWREIAHWVRHAQRETWLAMQRRPEGVPAEYQKQDK